MLLKAILSTLLLGTSSLALAQPYPPSDYSTESREWHRSGMRGQFVVARGITLTADRQASFIRVDPRTRLSRIRLDLRSGRAYIESVFVTHANGRQETVLVRQMLSPRTPRLVINLPGRDITGVAINSSQMRSARGGGGYRRMQSATINVIGLTR